MPPINASPVRGSISFVPQTEPAEVAGDTSALPASTETPQAIGSIVPPGGLHPIAGGTATAATLDNVVSDVAKDIAATLNADPHHRPVSGIAPFLVMDGGMQGVCTRR